MAAPVKEDEQSVYESTRLSLFDLILEKCRTQNKKQLVHRLYYVAKIRQEVSENQDIGAHYEKMFKNLQTQISGEMVTGLLLIYPKHFVHVLESSSNILFEVLRDLEVEVNSIGGLLQEAKLLCFTGDLPNRLFNQWCFRALRQSAAQIQEYTSNEPIHVVVTEAFHQILKLGEYLAKLPKISLTKAMDTLSEKVPELLVRQDLIDYLIKSKELSTPTDYLKRYLEPLDIVLDSELVWPMQPKLFPLSKT